VEGLRVERRLAAIMAADVAGYSRLMGADEEGTHARLTALRRDQIDPAIGQHHGRVIKHTGDGFLAEFASVVDAVRCALMIQDRVGASTGDAAQKIEFRIGINLADVISETDDLFGDGVNIAARLEGIAPPGGICLSRAAYDQVRGKIGVAARDMGPQQLKNIAEPVHAFCIMPGGEPIATAALPIQDRGRAPPVTARRAPRISLFVAAAGLAAAGVAFAVWRAPPERAVATAPPTPAPQPAPPVAPSERQQAPDRQTNSVVVLPFVNRGGNADDDQLADTITEDVTTMLRKEYGHFVIGLGTAAAYTGQLVDARQLGRDLGVRYAFEGSVRQVGERVRVDVNLLDTGTGAQLWSERMEEPRGGLGELAQALTRHIGRTAHNQILAAEAHRLAQEGRPNPNVNELLLRGKAIMATQSRTRERVDEVRSLFERAVALDDGSAYGHGALAVFLIDSVTFGFSTDREADLELAEQHALRGLAIDRNNGDARLAHAVVLRFRQQFPEALAILDSLIADQPSNTFYWANSASVLLRMDRPQEAISRIYEAQRINPRDWNRDQWFGNLGVATLMLGQDEESRRYYAEAHAANPSSATWMGYLAAADMLLGHVDAARRNFAEYRKALPTASVVGLRRNIQSDSPLWAATRERQIEALRSLGLPEE
jgi:class 3 adenylate cyclase/TolB-like protein/Flp pilus assembly protein TadD